MVAIGTIFLHYDNFVYYDTKKKKILEVEIIIVNEPIFQNYGQKFKNYVVCFDFSKLKLNYIYLANLLVQYYLFVVSIY